MIAKLLIANRGEVAIRVAQAAAELGLASVAIHSTDDAHALHVRRAAQAVALGSAGAAAYLDVARIVAIARDTGCDAVHPGYGFLSERADFARACGEAGLVFVGPHPDTLALFGDKAAARRFAAGCQVPILPGTQHATSLAEAREALRGGPIMIKALAGGGGRGVRAVTDAAALDEAYARCGSEAQAAFGSAEVYVERLVTRARHIEVQVAGEGGRGIGLYERECTLQRRHQKLIEIAPSPSLPGELRATLIAAAGRLAEAAAYRGLGTFEFLVELDPAGAPIGWFFLEANPRLQVEHTVTEEVLGLDLVQLQLELAGGKTLAELGLAAGVPAPTGYALQLRINMETMDARGEARPASGTLNAFELPFGAGIRVDTFGYVGYETTTAFDSLLAKLIVHTRGPDFADVVRKARIALAQLRIEGVATNIGFLQALLDHPAVVAGAVTTRFVEDHAAELVARIPRPAATQLGLAPAPAGRPGSTARPAIVAPPGTVAIVAPMQSKLVTVSVTEGDRVRPGQPVAIVEAMKMEMIVTADDGGIVRAIAAAPGEVVRAGDPLVFLEPAEIAAGELDAEAAADPDAIRADLAEVRARHAIGLDAARPAAVARRRETRKQTARENVAAVADPGSFTEYGALALAAQRRRRGVDELIEATPADGMITGLATINAPLFGPAARALVAAYDYTVLAGTQGYMNHKKLDRMLGLALERRLPVVLFAEGGGGRPGDTDAFGVGLDVPTFAQFARLSGLVPVIGIAAGRCFAGNAALLGCCDVIIATAESSIGMGGPAMIEGGGLGTCAPDDVGPARVQAPNGVIDVLVASEQEAAMVARQYLAYFQGRIAAWRCGDQRRLRRAIPENRLRVYDVRAVLHDLADVDSVLELRAAFGAGIVTALIRIEGRPFGVIANNPHHLGGAIDAPAADKAARFVQLCDAFDLPILALCDTPGFMVGPEAEKTALVRHVSRMFVTAASVTVPYFTIVLRKGYGLGAIAMAAGDFHGGVFTIAWPTGELGSMGFEGAVKLGYRKELDAIADPAARRARFDALVARYYDEGKALNAASYVEIDDVIDPADTRRWLLAGLDACPPPPPRSSRKRPCIDPW